ncbi:MAG: archaemetzincin family Zn-dependent metalloprotease [Infirmifilum sp.]
MAEYVIKILALGVEEEHIKWLHKTLANFFNAHIMEDTKSLTLGAVLNFYDEDREQINAEKLLRYLQEKIGVLPYQRILAIIEGDGFIEGLNFVFGVASPNWGGVVFTERLKQEFYGLPPSIPLFRMRLLKESLHELGHSFGLTHCPKNCVMRFSNSIYDVDDKPASYCASCTANINRYAPGLLRIPLKS